MGTNEGGEFEYKKRAPKSRSFGIRIALVVIRKWRSIVFLYYFPVKRHLQLCYSQCHLGPSAKKQGSTVKILRRAILILFFFLLQKKNYTKNGIPTKYLKKKINKLNFFEKQHTKRIRKELNCWNY